MKLITTSFLLLMFSYSSYSCEFLKNDTSNYNELMGKKSKFYDAYKQGKCVLENALDPLQIEQRKIIANLIAKSYKLEQ